MQSYGKNRKFSPLHMDDGEEYIMEFKGEVIVQHPVDKTEIKSKATLNFCSKSVIIEFEDPDAPELLYKYHYRNFTKAPELYKTSAVIIYVEKLVEVPLTAVPRGYISHKCKKGDELQMKFN